jgi:hypothetical protein
MTHRSTPGIWRVVIGHGWRGIERRQAIRFAFFTARTHSIVIVIRLLAPENSLIGEKNSIDLRWTPSVRQPEPHLKV